MLLHKAVTNDVILTQFHGIYLDLCNDLLNVMLSLLKYFSFNSIIWDYLFQFKSSDTSFHGYFHNQCYAHA